MDPECSATSELDITIGTKASLSMNEHASSNHPTKANQHGPSIYKHQNSLKRERSEGNVLLSSYFSTTTALSNFLTLRSHKSKKPRLNEDHGARKEPDNTQLTHDNSIPAPDTSETLRSIQIPPGLDPVNSTPSSPRPVVINTELLQQHSSLVRFLENRTVNIIYRDFKPFEPQPHIILDPKTCIFITNTQSLIQRSLPGHTATLSSPTRTIEKLASQFEVIYVLVLHGVVQTPTQSDTMVRFAGFCASFAKLNINVHPLWIEYTNATNLSDLLNAYTWSLVTKETKISEGDLQDTQRWVEEQFHNMNLTQDESKWELFLRQAGFNCMAAQLILSHMSENVSDSGDLQGLPLFIAMNGSERLERFSDLLGSRVVERVSCVLGH